MRTISPTLLAAQKRADRRPYARIEISDLEQGIRRLSWENIYQGAEPDNHHGIAFDDQGSLHRIRADADNRLYYQKVSNPGPTSDFSRWTEMAQDCYGPCAITARGAKVYVFYRTTDNLLWKCYSEDHGESWRNARLADYPDVSHLAASWRAGTSIAVCLALRLLAGLVQFNAITLDTETEELVQHIWSDPAHPLVEPLGIGATYDPDIPGQAIVLAARQSDSPYNHYDLFRTHFSDSGHFAPLLSLLMAPEGEGTSYEFPDCHRPESPRDYETTRIVVTEKFSGESSYTRPLTSHTVKGTAWTDSVFVEPRPFINSQPRYGLRMGTTGDHWWLEKPGAIWRAARAAADPLIITSDTTPGGIIALTQRAQASGTPQPALTIVLDNSRGSYSFPGEGSLSPLRPRAQITLRLGYKTSEGNETVEMGSYWIDGWEYSADASRSLFTIHARDGWGLMDSWTARFQMRWNKDNSDPTTVWQILYQLLGRAGICLSNDPPRPQSPAILNLRPDLSIEPGTRGTTALKRLLSLVPDQLVFNGQQAFTRDPLCQEESCYFYGLDHPIISGQYRESTTASRARTIGRREDNSRLLAEALDWDLIQLAVDILEQDYDPNLDSPARAEERAETLLRKSRLEARGAKITVPPNLAQELLDLITVSDRRCSIPSRQYRVTAITTSLEPEAARFSQQLFLSAPGQES